MFQLTPITTDNIFSLLTPVLTLLAIIVSFSSFNRALEQSKKQKKNEINLEELRNATTSLYDFSRSITDVVLGSAILGESSRLKAVMEFEKHEPQMRKALLMYGSRESILLFKKLVDTIYPTSSSSDSKGIEVPSLFALATLLFAQFRLDLTNNKLEIKSTLHLLFPELEDYREDDMAASIDGFVDKFSLDPSLKYIK